jgi:hypothetical protein
MRKAVTAGMTALGIATASFALTVLNPFSASAQTDSPSTTVPTPAQPATPAPTTPGTPAAPNHQGNCPGMGSDSSGGTTQGTSSATPAAYHLRAARF